MLKDEQQINKDKMKEKSKWAQFKYFWYYQWKIVLLIVVIIGCITSFGLHLIEANKVPSISVALVNSALNNASETNLLTDYALDREIDTDVNPAKLDVSFQLSESNSHSLYVANSEKLSAYLDLGDLDVIIAPGFVIENFANLAYFSNIETDLGDDYDTLVQELDTITYTYEEDGKVNLAFYVGDIPKIKELFPDEVEPYIAIGNYSSNKEAAIDFIHYLFNS